MPAGLQTWDASGRLTCDLGDNIGRLATSFDVGGYNNVYTYTIPSTVEYAEALSYSLMIDTAGGSMWGFYPPNMVWSGRTLTVTTSPLTALPAATWRILVVLR